MLNMFVSYRIISGERIEEDSEHQWKQVWTKKKKNASGELNQILSDVLIS